MRDVKKHTPRNKEKTWKRQEQRVADRLGGRKQPGSGSQHGKPGDVLCESRGLLIEAKATDKKSLSIKKDWLVKISHEAEQLRKVPAVAITFKGMPGGVDEDWIMVPISCAETLDLTDIVAGIKK